MSGRLMDKDFNWEEFLEEQEREIEEFRKKHNIK
jgi:hypothetical protein